MGQEKKVFLAIRIPEVLKHKIKVKAVERKMSIQFYIKEIIENNLKDMKYEKPY